MQYLLKFKFIDRFKIRKKSNKKKKKTKSHN